MLNIMKRFFPQRVCSSPLLPGFFPVPSLRHLGADTLLSPLSQQPWRQCSSSCAPCWSQRLWQTVGAWCFPHTSQEQAGEPWEQPPHGSAGAGVGRGAAAMRTQSPRVCGELPGLGPLTSHPFVCSFPVATKEKEEEDPFNYGE